jgi:hypothetical protein
MGKVIRSIRIEGMGIIKIRKMIGKRRVLKKSFPRRKRIIPPKTTNIENLIVKYSVASFPNRSNAIPKMINPSPSQFEDGLRTENCFRLS